MNLQKSVPFWLLVVLQVLAFALPANGQPNAEMPVKGRVMAKGQGLAGATVRLLPTLDRESGHFCAGESVPKELTQTTSDRQGYFELKAKQAGFYRLVLEAKGYVGVVEEVTLLSPSQGFLPPIHLAPARRIQLEVFGPEGEKIEGARIRYFFSAVRGQQMSYLPPWPELILTGKDGRVSLLMPVGSNGVAVIAAPGLPVLEVFLRADSPEVQVRLEAGREVFLETVDHQGRPLPNVAIANLVVIGQLLMPIGCSAPSGRAQVRVPPGKQTLYFFDATGRAVVETFQEAAPVASAVTSEYGSPAPQRVFLPAPVVVSSWVVEAASGEIVPDAWVYVPGKRPVVSRSDRRGHFELSLPPFYTGRIHAYKAGYSEAEVKSNEAARAIPLRRAFRFEGLVVEPGGRGLEGATVRIMSPEESWHRSTTTGSGGRFLLEEVAEYPIYELLAHFEGRASKVYLLDIAAHEGGPLRLEIPPAGQLAVRILDERGQPIAGAEVFAVAADSHRLGLETRSVWRNMPGLGPSDAEGRIRSDRLKAGDYQLGVLAAGFAPRVQSGVRVGPAAAEAAPEEEIIVLQAAAATRGVVVDEAGQPIEGAGIFLLWPGSDRSLYRRGPPLLLSDAKGEFLVREWAAGQKVLLRAEKAGYVPTVLPEIEIGRDQRWVLELKKAGSLRGRVLTGENKILEAQVGLSPRNAPMSPISLPANTYTQRDGSFVLENLAPGPHDLTVRGVPGYQVHQSGPIEIVAGRQLEMDIELNKAAVVFGRVTRLGGEPARNARVQIRSSSGSHFSEYASVQVDALGQYRIEDAAPGSVTVEVYSDGPQEPFTRQVEIVEGLNELDLVLDRLVLSLFGQVQGPGGEPIAGAVVRLEPSSKRSTSRADGSVAFEGIEAGNYFLAITKDGYFFPPKNLELVAGGRQDFVWQLQQATLVVEGVLLGLPPEKLDSVEVYARNFQDGRKGIVSKGRFRIENLAAGSWTLVAQVGRRVVERKIELNEGDAVREESLDFSGLGGFLARVVANGQPLRDAYYHFAAVGNEERPVDGGNSFDGRLELWASPGTYSLVVGHGGLHKKLTVEIVHGEPTEQVIDLATP